MIRFFTQGGKITELELGRVYKRNSFNNNMNELQQRFDELTGMLKEMTGNEPDYEEVWNERVEVKRKMLGLEP